MEWPKGREMVTFAFFDHEYEFKITVEDDLSSASRTTRIPVLLIEQ